MSKKWDYDVPSVELWQEVLRVLKPGGHALIACGTRTQHRMAVNLEDAGFEIRDIVAWVYGSGFPKSLNISKALEKMAGVEPVEKIPNKDGGFYGTSSGWNATPNRLKMPPTQTEEAKKWQGYGTALKPAMELWTLCRKPIKGTVASNVLEWGTGGLNIDGCRVGIDKSQETDSRVGTDATWGGKREASKHTVSLPAIKGMQMYKDNGRFPANLIHDGSDEVVGLFPNDTQRFFYTPKASKSERNKGLEGFEEKEVRGGGGRANDGYDENDPEQQRLKTAAAAFGAVKVKRANTHPTVKPVSLMRYLCKLITPKGGTILDPFMGSGTTGIGAKLEGFDFIGIEREEDYLKIAEARIAAWEPDAQEKLL